MIKYKQITQSKSEKKTGPVLKIQKKRIFQLVDFAILEYLEEP